MTASAFSCRYRASIRDGSVFIRGFLRPRQVQDQEQNITRSKVKTGLFHMPSILPVETTSRLSRDGHGLVGTGPSTSQRKDHE